MERQLLQKLRLPNSPGVYRFLGKKGEILYIGKATSLKNRVRSYFAGDIAQKRGPAIAQMVSEVKTVKCDTTDSVLESLILESNLIKKYQPRYNVKEKDDKSFNYIVITKEDFPRVLLVRGRELGNTDFEVKQIFGPFPKGGVLKDALKIIRKIFPFYDNCKPGQGKPCFNAQIGLCPGVCDGRVTKAEYGNIIKNLSLFLSGKKKVLVRKLKSDMKSAAKLKHFEAAAQIKKTLFALTHIQDIALIKNADAINAGNKTVRIEAYDIAHISGTAQVGAMTVVEGGEPAKQEYRKFKIRTVKGVDDTASLAEVLLRRFGHPEWPYPRIVVVDGGLGQKNRAEKTLREIGIQVPVVSVVKDEHHRPRNILGDAALTRRYEREIILANAEAHRFAITYHRGLRSHSFRRLGK